MIRRKGIKIKRLVRCEICDNGINLQFLGYAIISPWVRKLAKISFFTRSKLYFCPKCNSAYFSHRYSVSEINSLYGSYRDESYNALRHKWENWYTSEYSAAHENLTLISKRNALVKDFLMSAKVSNITSVIDVGGDRGQFLSNFESAARYVLEMSHRSLEPGVVRKDKLSNADFFDLILYSHVLEHVVSPIAEIKSLMVHSDAIYIEVPNGLPKTTWFRRNFLFSVFFQIFSLNPMSWKFFSGPAAGRGYSHQILKQSEHINFFSQASFKHFGEALNLTVTIKECLIPTPDGTVSDVLQVLMVKK
jgi:hypothetical protein